MLSALLTHCLMCTLASFGTYPDDSHTNGTNSRRRCTPGGISTTNFLQPALCLFCLPRTSKAVSVAAVPAPCLPLRCPRTRAPPCPPASSSSHISQFYQRCARVAWGAFVNEKRKDMYEEKMPNLIQHASVARDFAKQLCLDKKDGEGRTVDGLLLQRRRDRP
jgi:hypothetical protein